MGVGSGGHARSGPPPDPNALRRDRRDDAEWFSLPNVPRAGAPPAWPLEGPSDRESKLWALLWSKPQATMWERFGVELEVAIYVRRFAEYELPDASASLGSLVARSADALGLTIPGMRANRWRLIDTGQRPAAEQAERKPARTKPRKSMRDRFTVVDGDGG